MSVQSLHKRVRRLSLEASPAVSIAERLRGARQAMAREAPADRLARLETMKPSKLRDRLIRAYRRQIEGAK
jgi:hypothetical protein